MNNKHYVIAIGTSAGGMNQINTFFNNTPIDGVSYIIIQHLPAEYKSMLALLPEKHSKLDIKEAGNNMIVETNKVYLLPAKEVMTIKDGRLMLLKKQKGTNQAINTFFTSLSEERGEKAIGIILSGTGTDGTDGIRAIKNAGGMLMVSEPESAEFMQMPASAIATGLVDYVVPPDKMPEVIQHYLSERSGETEIDDEDDEKTMAAITDLIRGTLPEDFTDYKKGTLLRRIKRRALLNNLNTLESYFNLLKKDPEELQSLSKDFLISVTSFFRDKSAFLALQEYVVPELIKSKQGDIKMWVPGCATGEEAYSLAILLREQLDAAGKNKVVKIFSSDIDRDALQYAARGHYRESIEKDVSSERLEKFFSKDHTGYKVKPFIREMLIFANHDLAKNPPYCNMDLISCRNLLIYMNPELQKKVLSILHFGLRYGGYLFLGPSENLSDLSYHLHEVDKKWKIYKNIEAKKVINFDAFVSAFSAEKRVFTPWQVPPQVQSKKAAVPNHVDMGLLVEMGYAGVWVDAHNKVLKNFGDTDRFLLPKLFNHQLPELLPEQLQVAFRAASAEADKTQRLIEVKGVETENGNAKVTLIVKPLSKEDDIKRLVLFSGADQAFTGKQTIEFDKSFYQEKYTAGILEELRLAKEELASTRELLSSSNENMQSFTEELLSANEEMQSTNEEMQSVNEELYTINSEYQSKIKELSELNDDLNNYFRSNVNGQIFVNNDLLLKKFSPSAAKHVNLREMDIGRPITNMSTNIKFETIEKDIRQVIANGGIITKEIEATDGEWYQVMTMPYLRKGNDQTDGAIITFNQISELKQIQQELAESNKSLKAINGDLDNFVYTASHDLLGPINNMKVIVSLIREKRKMLDKDTIEYVDMLSSSVEQFQEVIKEMAGIGKIESEMLHLEAIDLEGMIKEVLASLKWNLSTNDAEVRIILEAKTITFSRKNCRSMLYNLISNAVKFKSPERALKIDITSKDIPGYVLLTIKDNGIGIEKEKTASIFEMYKKLNVGEEGQGLGLFLIKKIIDASGGKVEVESEPGYGSEFRLFLKS